MIILGISAYYHDSAVALIEDGEILYAVQEERFSRKKQDATFPNLAIEFCLKEANISLEEIDYIAFYDKPFIKFERLLETYLTEAPRGFLSFVRAIPIWLKEKLFIKDTLANEFKELYLKANPKASKKEAKAFKKEIAKKLRFGEHHQSHASSAFFPSPFEEAVVLTIDGVGEWTTTSIAHGKGEKLEFLKEIRFPHSLGLFYSAITYYLGFKVNSGEYKVMGLAPYGEPIYADLMRKELIDIKDDGSFHLNMEYFNYTVGLTMTNNKFNKLFNAPPREKESELGEFEMNIASSLQAITNEIMIKLAKHAKELTGCNNLTLAGGVALNCVANGEILKENIFENIWIQPASSDAGASLGVAYALYHHELGNKRAINADGSDKMQGSYLGLQESQEEIERYLLSTDAKYHTMPDEVELIDRVTDALVDGKVVGWHTGKMEFGPRALGHRSILGDPRDSEMQKRMNLKIKYRESFRPFAPSVLREKVSEWFELDSSSPYMLLTADVAQSKRIETKVQQNQSIIEKLNIKRSLIPAVTHVDNSARVQSVDEKSNGRYYRLIADFYRKTNCPVLINTSFNVRGEPIVCTAEDSYRCFMRTEMDVLVLENAILYKEEQPDFKETNNWQEEFELD